MLEENFELSVCVCVCVRARARVCEEKTKNSVWVSVAMATS